MLNKLQQTWLNEKLSSQELKETWESGKETAGKIRVVGEGGVIASLGTFTNTRDAGLLVLTNAWSIKQDLGLLETKVWNWALYIRLVSLSSTFSQIGVGYGKKNLPVASWGPEGKQHSQPCLRICDPWLALMALGLGFEFVLVAEMSKYHRWDIP